MRDLDTADFVRLAAHFLAMLNATAMAERLPMDSTAAIGGVQPAWLALRPADGMGESDPKATFSAHVRCVALEADQTGGRRYQKARGRIDL